MTLQEVHSEFQRRLGKHGKVVIAGGAVRDCLMGRSPKDWDIFILQGEDFDFKTAKEAILTDLADLTAVKPVVEWHNSEPFLVATLVWNDAQVQVLVNPQPTMESLVATFDWNVCMFAFDGERTIAEPLENIGHGKTLRLNTVTFPASTLRRGYRFSERFMMKLDLEAVVELCRLIIKKADAKNNVGPSGNVPDAQALEKNVLIDDKPFQ